MKYLLCVFFLTCSAFASAAGDSNFSLGLGGDHGGLGAKYAINRDEDKYFATLGLLGYSEHTGWTEGYGIGWERLVSSDRHTVGTFLGAVSSDSGGRVMTRYHGISLLYNYYFSGFSDSSWVIGGDIYGGVSEDDDLNFDDELYGIKLKFAYQW
ncbi:hypothetical protein ACJJIF_06850 [Microbulbifer sp. SSSA002]|uniref:hypothetical protein n=1 Tax=unclassified Microbulbifer TaxID=2619833 RepID=UPI00403A63A3